jgi:uncharacterized protein
MLLLKPDCECCDIDLPPDSREAMICSFEYTFCRHCAEGVLKGRCPNCGGELLQRPIRPAAKLALFPASRQRVFKPDGCLRGLVIGINSGEPVVVYAIDE